MSQEATPRHIRDIVSPVFGDNIGIALWPVAPKTTAEPSTVPATPSHSLIYLGTYIFQEFAC